MQKIRGVNLFCLLCALLMSTNTIANQEKNQQKSKVGSMNIYEVYSKILYFDSLELKDSIAYYTKQAYELSNEIDLNTVESKENQLIIAEIYRKYGLLNFFSNDIFESISGYEKAIDIFTKYDRKAKLADCFTSLATNYSKIGKEPKAMELMQKATSMFIDLDDKRGIMVGYRSIGLLYKRQRDNLRALDT